MAKVSHHFSVPEVELTMDTDGILEITFSETEGITGLSAANGTIELNFIPVNTGVCGSLR